MKPVHEDPSCRWFWLSFADETGNLGVAIVPVTDAAIDTVDKLDPDDTIELLRGRGQEDDVPFYTAVRVADISGCNPGGSVQGYEVTDKIDEIPMKLRTRLLTKTDLELAGLV